MPTVMSYTRLGGAHAETAAVANTLAALGLRAPHTGAPYSEALLLGIAGGLGAGYILYDFKKVTAKILVFGWQNRWNYPVQFYTSLSERLGLKQEIFEGGAKAGLQRLTMALEAGQPAIAWVDRYQLPYYGIPDHLQGCLGNIITVYGLEREEALIDDLALKPFRLPAATLAAARGRVGSYKNRLLLLSPGQPRDLADAVIAGIDDCVSHLSETSESFSLPVLRKWAHLLTDEKHAKGWPMAFPNGSGLYSALASVYENIELFSTGGGALRGLYGDFLNEAAVILNRPRLTEAAGRYHELAQSWSRFAFEALDAAPTFRETRDLLRQKYTLLREKGSGASAEIEPIRERLSLFAQKYAETSPLTAVEQRALFAHLSESLLTLFNAETAALETLRRLTA